MRFGAAAEPWFDELPDLLRALAERWRIELGPPIPRGTVSVVIRCRAPDGAAAVLKVSPDRARLAHEAAALERWTTAHAPSVLAFDETVGALLIEAIDPGTPLDSSPSYPSLERMADLLRSLHRSGVPDPSYPLAGERAAYLFDSSARLYELRPKLAEVVTPQLYERGRRLAARLARSDLPAVLLHGDLTPTNILDGGEERGLVAIDPAPCVGDAAFDAVDLVLWRAGDVETVEGRVERLAPAIGADTERLLGWCIAFAGMTALELASSADPPRRRIDAAVALAARA